MSKKEPIKLSNKDKKDLYLYVQNYYRTAESRVMEQLDHVCQRLDGLEKALAKHMDVLYMFAEVLNLEPEMEKKLEGGV